MTTSPLTRAVRTLQSAGLRRDGGGLSDGQLLECFLGHHDEAAFEALVRRHGPMVLGVCRRVLGNVQDAEDAFQAVFLVLVRKAATVRPREQVGNWLHGVAYRTALKARVRAARRRKHEKQVTAMPHPEVVAEEQWQELQPVLDQELQRLPDKYRLPLVLCDLEGRTRRDVARQLGVPDGTLSNRIAAARRTLARRLAQRGVTLSGGALAAVLAQNVAAGVPPPLVVSTVKAATHVAAGGAAAAAVSAEAAALTEGVLKAMLWNKLKPVAVALLLAAFAAGVGSTLHHARAAAPPAPAAPPAFVLAQGQAQAAPKTPPGRIYYHLGSELVSTQPDGQKRQEHGRNFQQGYQMDSARLSPDGKFLAFGTAVVRQTGGMLGAHPPDNIYLRDLTKNAEPELLVQMEGLEFLNWVWSPDGGKIALTSWDAKEITRNWVVDVKTKKVEEVKLPRFKFEKQGEIQMSIQAWSPDGARFLAYGDGLHLVKTDGSDAKRLTALPGQFAGRHSRFSPDGAKVLFVVRNKEKSANLYTADVKDGKLKALVEANNFYDLRACWSPDGKQIAYAVTPMDANGERGEETTLFVIDADGSNTRTVTTEKHGARQVVLTLTDWR